MYYNDSHCADPTAGAFFSKINRRERRQKATFRPNYGSRYKLPEDKIERLKTDIKAFERFGHSVREIVNDLTIDVPLDSHDIAEIQRLAYEVRVSLDDLACGLKRICSRH